MECLKYCQEGKEGVPNWYTIEQAELKKVFEEEKAFLIKNCLNLFSDTEQGKKAIYLREAEHLLRLKMDFWD